MDLTLTITIKEEELNTDAKITALVNALVALAPKPEQPAETDENGFKIIPTDDEPETPAAPSPDDEISKAIAESEKRREARTKKAEKVVEDDVKAIAPAASETEVRMALGKLQRTDGGKAKVRAILNGLGAKNFPDLDPAKYAEAFALAVEELKKIDAEDSE